jgi:nucleoid-associated protein YgaU
MTLTCPVDGRENISEDFCPQCGADLRPLWRAKRLPDLLLTTDQPKEKIAPPPAPPATWPRMMASFLGGALLVGVVSYAVRPQPLVKSTGPTPPAPKTVIEYREKPMPTVEYRVRVGDSLWRIAEAKYGRAAHWKEIERVNLDRIQQRKGIFPGDTLMLPSITLTPRE